MGERGAGAKAFDFFAGVGYLVGELEGNQLRKLKRATVTAAVLVQDRKRR